MRYMLDTNTASQIIKGHPSARKHLTATSASQILVSAITEAELLFGLAKKSSDSQALKVAVHEFLLLVDVVAWDSEATRQYAIVRAALERQGKPLGNLDTLIAAHALATDSILVTGDKAFNHVSQLKQANWTA